MGKLRPDKVGVHVVCPECRAVWVMEFAKRTESQGRYGCTESA